MKKTKMLKKNYEFSNVFINGKYYSGKSIEAFILNNRQGANYLGLAISVKSGHAFQRNRLKRLLRENYQKLENNIAEGNSIVFLLKKKADIKKVSFNQVKEDMEEILKHAKILKTAE